jgi:hypothetical protein
MGKSYYFLKRTPLEPLRKQNKQYVLLTDKEIRRYFEEFYNYKSELDKHIKNSENKKNI